MAEWLVSGMEDNLGLLLDIHRSVGEIGAKLSSTSDELLSIKDYMIKWQTAMGERVGSLSERLTVLETHVNHIEERVDSNAEVLKGHESPEEFLHKKSYNFLVAAGAALIGVIISKLGEIIAWFKSL